MRIILILLALAVSGCEARPAETITMTDDMAVEKELPLSQGVKLALVRSGTGGGAGDITHRVLVCPDTENKCEIVAIVDVNDRLSPDIIQSEGRILLLLNKSDYIAGFKSFSQNISGLSPGAMIIGYR